MSLRLVDYLEHICEAAFDAISFVEGMRKEDFLADKRSQKAVVMSLLIMGEAAARLMDEFPDFASANPQVPWRNMRGMRNRIAHGYFEIDMDVVWDTLHSALPDLLKSLPRQDGSTP